MKNMRKTVSLLFISFCFISSIFAEINFIQGDLRMAKERAAREGKLILLDFWANYCTPCRMMEEYTFTNSDVEDYIKAHYIPVKVDIQSFDGYDLKNQFKVSVLPTIIVLTSKGIQVGRHEETFSASRLIPVLTMYNLPKNRLKSNSVRPLSYNEITSNSNNGRSSVSHSTPVKNTAATSTKIPKTDPPSVKPSSVKLTIEPSLVKSSSSKLAIAGATLTTATPNTFTIQIAAYFSEDRLKEAMPEVKRDFENKQKIFVSKRRENNKLIYRVLIGQFPSRQEADKYLKSIGIEGIIKDFNVLK